ncbi:MAG TPA: MarR family winged helix-turn-helix transcriptional regulator [Candidatus Blautia faecipullorum]|nr:MarR family winged helix-turn-helix transcriptional regulator [Candidatus Blautia faecipullorum]
MRANDLTEILHLDKSYISRLIRNFGQKEMITREVSKADKRNLIIKLTPKGEKETDRLIRITNQEILKLIENFTPVTCEDLCKSMKRIIDIFSKTNYSQEEENHEQ